METGKELQLTVTRENALTKITSEERELVKSMIMFPGATDAETSLVVFQCLRRGFHPLDKMIHPIKFQGDDPKMILINSIDLFRSDAEETGEYAGQDEAEFEWDEEKDPDHTGYPLLARVRIYRKGFERPFIGIARWKEFYPGDNKRGNIWRKMPCNQLSKCAEAQGFRKAFPKKFHDFYIPEEMDQAQVDPKEQRKDRSASVKPAPPAGKVIDAEHDETGTTEENPLDKEIMETLAALTGGVYEEMEAMLRKVSHYTDKATKKDFEFGLEKLPSISAAWKTKTVIPRLRKWKGEADAIKAEIAEGNKEQAAEEEQGLPID